MAKSNADLAFEAKSKIRQSAGDKALNLFFVVFILVFAVVCITPFLLVVSASFSDETMLNKLGYSIFPRQFSLDAYKLVTTAGDIPQAYIITIFTTVVGTFLSLIHI